MPKLPNDCPKREVINAFEKLGFGIVREREHISMVRENENGSKTYITIPNHRRIKATTLRTICTQADIKRDAFIEAYENS